MVNCKMNGRVALFLFAVLMLTILALNGVAPTLFAKKVQAKVEKTEVVITKEEESHVIARREAFTEIIDDAELVKFLTETISEKYNNEDGKIFKIVNKVVSCAKRYDNVTPEIMLGIIERESSFRINAISKLSTHQKAQVESGKFDEVYRTAYARTYNEHAFGICQFKPSTAKWVGERLGIQVDSENLMDPILQIELACEYFAYLCDRYSDYGDYAALYALHAYSSGPTRTDELISGRNPIHYSSRNLVYPSRVIKLSRNYELAE